MDSRNLSFMALMTGVKVSGVVSSTSAAGLLPAPAQASAYYPDAGIALATSNWTGFYAGASCGYLTSNAFTEKSSAWTGGVQAGFMQQLGRFVLGAEAQALPRSGVPQAGETKPPKDPQ